jgi:hypothetical protein
MARGNSLAAYPTYLDYGIYGYGATHTVEFKDIMVDGYPGGLPGPCGGEVDIDIKPGSNPNSINLKSKGVVPVAVLTTDDYDATFIDPDTVTFASASPLRWAVEDVDGDGDADLLFHFKTQELGESSTSALLEGYTENGTYVWGTDTVNIVPK